MKGVEEKTLMDAAEILQKACRDDHFCKICPFGDGGECEKTWGNNPPYKWELPTARR
jgi:hypothetical protein